jgi:transposase InsO family protein
MKFPLVRDLASEGIPIEVTCGVLGFSSQAYRKWRANPISDRDWSDAHLINAALDIHADDPEFGYRFIADELEFEHGIVASENRVARLCSVQGIFSVLVKKKRRILKPGPPVHDDHVRREFTADGPDRVWFTDITEHPTAEGKLYICALKDAWSNRIVGYSIGDRMTAELAVFALRNAVEMRGSVAGTIVHSDRGGQFRSRKFRRALAEAQMVGSMGRVGTCADNAAMESFFSLLQKNVFDRKRWGNREELRLASVRWIERTYHRRRRQRALGRLTPVEFETVYAALKEAA